MIAGSRGKSMFSFLRNRQTVFHSGWTILHSHQRWMRVPVAPHPCQPNPTFGAVSVLDFGHSNRCAVESHCCFNSQFPNDLWFRASFHMLIAICIYSLRRSLFRSFAHFKIRLFSYWWVLIVLCIFWIPALYQIVFCRYFLPVCGLSFHSLNSLSRSRGF